MSDNGSILEETRYNLYCFIYGGPIMIFIAIMFHFTRVPALTDTTLYLIVHGYKSGPTRGWVKNLIDSLMKQTVRQHRAL